MVQKEQDQLQLCEFHLEHQTERAECIRSTDGLQPSPSSFVVSLQSHSLSAMKVRQVIAPSTQDDSFFRREKTFK